ncbi:MAG TPA: dihydroneopterin aldolase [Acidimicrobiia bacterium]|nr:folB [Acidimicrobiia bacterium]HYJ25164.1 dihydroneopterin aldolase [Acidimicrobiia bacterium]
MTDRIELKGIEVVARHGVLEHEKQEPQVFRIDLTLYLDLSNPGTSDNLADTVDYGKLAQVAHDLVQGESHDLIESVAQQIAAAVLDEPLVDRVRVTVHKPEAPIPLTFSDVAVTVDRSR